MYNIVPKIVFLSTNDRRMKLRWDIDLNDVDKNGSVQG